MGGPVGTRQLHDVGSRDLGDLLGPFGGPRLQFAPHVDEAGYGVDGRAVGERYLEYPVQCDLHVVGETQSVGTGDDGGSGGQVHATNEASGADGSRSKPRDRLPVSERTSSGASE